MASANERIQSLIVDHTVNVRAYSANVVRRMISALNRADTGLFAKLVEKLQYMNPERFTVRRLDALLDDVSSLNQAAYASFHGALRSELGAFTDSEISFQSGLLAHNLPPAFPVARIAVEQVLAGALSRPFQGKLLKEWVTDQAADKMDRIRVAVADGFVQNKTTDEIVRDLRGTRSTGYRDGLLDITRRNADAVVRTAISHTAAYAQDAVYLENLDIIKEYQWMSTLDTRTTPQCQVRDGLRYTAGKTPQPIGHSYEWGGGPGKLHWCCRSTKAPVTKSWRDLGVNIDEFSAGTRASMDGQVPEKTTYEEWLHAQSPARQDEVLGATRGALFRSGKLSLRDMYAATGKELTLTDLAAKNKISLSKQGGAVFASPNISEGSMNAIGAQKEFGSVSQANFAKVSNRIDALVGINGQVRNAIGAWSDGAENSTVTLFGKASAEQVRVAAAMRGLIGEQKAAIPFNIHSGGKQRIVTFDAFEKDPALLSKQLTEAGLEFHTLVPLDSGGFRVMLFEESPTLKSLNTARAASSFFGTESTLQSVRGTGEFLGSWTDRIEGRTAYEGVIKDWIGTDTTRASEWNKIVNEWNFTVTPKPAPL